jgi:hypothetical protein
LKEGFYLETEIPVKKFDFVLRWDGMRRRGNTLAGSQLSDDSRVLRYTAGLTYQLIRAMRLKVSAEYYDFNDFDDDVAFHLGVAGPF